MGLFFRSAVIIAVAGVLAPASVSAQQATPGTESGSFQAPVAGGSLQSGPPAAGSIGVGKPSAGSLTIGKPSAGSLSSGRPAAGSIASGVGAGSLAPPAGTVSTVSGASRRRLESVDDGSSRTRKAREPHVRRYQ